MAKQDVVFSMPFVLNRMGDFFNDYKWIGIKQKIPLRLFIGIQKHLDAIDYDTITIYNHKSNVFEDVSKNSISYLEDALTHLKKTYNLTGVKFSILSEIPKWYWMWFNAILNSLLDTITNYYLWNISLQDIEEWRASDNISNIIYNTSFGKVFENPNKLIPSFWKVWFTTIVSSFFNGEFPILWLRWKMNEDIKLKFYNHRFQTLLTHNNLAYRSPLDVSLIYSWISSCMECFDYQYNDFNEWMHIWAVRLLKVLDDIEDDLVQISSIFNRVMLSDIKNIEQSYNDILGSVWLEVLYKFIDAIEWNSTDKQQSNLIIALNKIRLSNFLTKDTNEKLKKILTELLWLFNSSLDDIAFQTNDPIITGWSIIISSKIDSLRDKIKQIWAWSDYWIVNYYNSFQDGRESDGIVIEKNETAINGNYIVLYSCDGTKKIIGRQEIEDEVSKFDIIFDDINGKIIVKQKPLSSKEILSQQTTVELFYKLITSSNWAISNKDLYKSTYTENKSEMQSKIIKRFINCCDNIFGKDCIQLNLSGTSSHFTISCISSLSYWVIHKYGI